MADYVEIDIDQGTDFNLDLGIKNDDGTQKDVTGYTFASSIKKSFYSLNPIATFTIDYDQASTGNIILSLTAAETANTKPGRYLFDIKQTDTFGKIERLAEGVATIHPQVTE